MLDFLIFIFPRKIAVILASKLKYKFIHDHLDPNIKRKKSYFNTHEMFILKNGIHGEQLFVNINDHIGFRYYINGFFDDIPFQVCKSLGFDNVFFIDIGANVGSISVPIAYSGTNVIAIEPQLRLINNLIHNLAVNEISNCIALPIALGSENESFLTLHTQPGNSGAASFKKNWNSGKISGIDLKVPVFKFDTVIYPFLTNQNYAGKIFIIKLDVEGFESEVLHGAVEFIKEFKPIILFENRPDLSGASDSVEFLKMFNYDFFGLRNSPTSHCESIDTLKWVDFDLQLKYENVLAIPSKLKHLLIEIFPDISHK